MGQDGRKRGLRGAKISQHIGKGRENDRRVQQDGSNNDNGVVITNRALTPLDSNITPEDANHTVRCYGLPRQDGRHVYVWYMFLHIYIHRESEDSSR